MTAPKRYLVTAALPYANGPLHIGHLAGCYIPSDIYVRYLKANKRDVVFICGSDEHGVAITIKARKEGITAQQVVDKYHVLMRDAFRDFGIDFTHYGRTSAPIHHETAAAFFKDLYDKGLFKEIETEQYFDEEANQFLADRYIVGTCPRCGNENAYGDQCEKCGSALSPTELINPRSTLSGNAPVLRKTVNWFLPMDEIAEKPEFKAYADRLAKEPQWKPNVRGQFLSWLNAGLQSRSMTRDLDWGVKVPLPNAEGKVLYVWFDAPIGYISATKEYFEQKGDAQGWEPYWKSNDTALIHFIGKDNIVFHTVIFPMILQEHGSYILPWNVPANEFLNLEGDKISTSRNWAIWLHEYLQDFPGRQDELRYMLTSIAPETKDSDFTWKDYQLRVNSELVAILGNYVNRVVVLTHKFFEGKVPAITHLQPGDDQLLKEVQETSANITRLLENCQFREAQAEMMNLARLGNKYLTENEPWKQIKTDPERVKTVMNLCLQLCGNLAIASQPFLPFTAQRLTDTLKITLPGWDQLGSQQLLAEGHTIGEPIHLFTNVPDEQIQAQVDRLNQSKAANAPVVEAPAHTPLKEAITYDDFAKMDLRVGTIIAAEKVKDADKLLKLTIDLGFEQRTVVSGIALSYTAEEALGKQVTLLANLKPRKIKGIESNGMILMADDPSGRLVFVSPLNGAENGATIA